MKRLFFFIAVVVLVMILAGSSASAVSDTITIDNNAPDNHIITSGTESSNSSAGASITITMYTVADESVRQQQ